MHAVNFELASFLTLLPHPRPSRRLVSASLLSLSHTHIASPWSVTFAYLTSSSFTALTRSWWRAH